jgi:hypothetical protein
MREIADVRVHGTTGERPIDRFAQTEAAALQPLPANPVFVAEHQRASERRQRVVAKGHWQGLVPSRADIPTPPSESPPAPRDSELGRPLSVYQDWVPAQKIIT